MNDPRWYIAEDHGSVTHEEAGWMAHPVDGATHGPYRTLEFAVQALKGEIPRKEAVHERYSASTAAA